MTDGQVMTNFERVYIDNFNSQISQGRRAVGNGCEVRAQTVPDMSVHIEAGTVYFNSSAVSVNSSNVAISAADVTYSRFDNILVTNTGLPIVVQGTPGADPIPTFADIDDYVYLARVIVEANVSTIETSDIKDLRTFFDLPGISDDPTKVPIVGGTMTGVLTSPVTILQYNGRNEGGYLYTLPRSYTSEVLVLSLQTSVAKTTSSTLLDSTNYIKKTTIYNQGPDTALILLDTTSTTATRNNTFPIFPGSELIIEDHVLNYYSGITATQNAIIDITNEFALKSPFLSDDLHSDVCEILQLQGNGNYAGEFSTLSTSNIQDVGVFAYNSSAVYLNLNGVASTSNIYITQGTARIYNNVDYRRFNLYSTVTSEVRIIGIGR